MFTKGGHNRHPANVGRGNRTADGVGPYSKSGVKLTNDPRITESGDYRAPDGPVEHGDAIERASDSSAMKVRDVTGWRGLSAPMPSRGQVAGSINSSGLSRPSAPRKGKSYLGG
jgi:hypothetical protein